MKYGWWRAIGCGLGLALNGGLSCAPNPESPPTASADDGTASSRAVGGKDQKDSGVTEGLPEGPCRQAVSCEETRLLMNADLTIEGRKVCFWDYDARCACAQELKVDDHETCNEGYY